MSGENLPNIEMVSNQACLLTFSRVISEATSNYIAQVTQYLVKLEGIVDLVPSYTTLLVVFDDDHYDRFAIFKTIRQTIEAIDPNDFSVKDQREVVIPVYYGKEVGPDIEDVAKHCHLSISEIIQRHSETTYRAYAIGFTPGFAFLGNTPDELHVPRKTTPRLKVPVGSVALAENQTAVYPSVTPGGWQIIGRTPVNLIDWGSENLALIAMGDSVRFEPISRDEFLVQGGQLDGF
ncbi:MAG: 5-oxoprolinase subunit PxpB [Marinomonas foliarum]|uniref:5-oxoprolinase subunit PxpB n=1 Tax=Marinomonas foliarum TaxID=491950 RepID=A0ABX7IJM9_9GAMM|nr:MULTISPECIES: 5-oxoprolinase subunit PxpB [Marinomonas]QRV22522.1 5-oxoprolinase subunit PxpB [Marinomonas foliarum]UTV99884.1 5-oxoprolinase subunit PxpB [Marinomonas rhizomae]